MATARATRRSGFEHEVRIGDHPLTVDEPPEKGGTDQGPSPTRLLAGALAGCVAITMEMYAGRKGWELGELSVDVEVEGDPTRGEASYRVTLHLPEGLSEEQIERLTRIAGKCPVHRIMARETEIRTEHVVGG